MIPDERWEQPVDGHRGYEQEELVDDPGLPSVDDFSFDGILKAVDPEGSFLSLAFVARKY